MVGNNLSRDIKGAKAMGITSVHLNWTPRYPKTPADDSERPDYTISEPMELVELIERLNREYTEKISGGTISRRGQAAPSYSIRASFYFAIESTKMPCADGE